MQDVRQSLESDCEHWSKTARLCVLVARSVATFRWCLGDGPAMCKDVVDHSFAVTAREEPGAINPDEAPQLLGEALRACLADALITHAFHRCVMAAKSLDDIETCAAGSP